MFIHYESEEERQQNMASVCRSRLSDPLSRKYALFYYQLAIEMNAKKYINKIIGISPNNPYVLSPRRMCRMSIQSTANK